METSPPALSAQARAPSAPGFRPRTGLRSADSEFCRTSCPPIAFHPIAPSYVQELEARLLHMESLFTQIAPALGQMQTPNGASGLSLPQDPTVSNAAATILQSLADKDQQAQSNFADNHSTPDSSASVKVEDDVTDSLGQLTLDEHGHPRWIGGSSTISLIQSFRAATSAPHYRVSPISDDASAPNKLYFPASVFFGKVRALPMPEEVEYPERDLADKLVSPSVVASDCV